MKAKIYFAKQILSLMAFVLLISVLVLKLKETRLERKLDQLKQIIETSTIYTPDTIKVLRLEPINKMAK